LCLVLLHRARTAQLHVGAKGIAAHRGGRTRARPCRRSPARWAHRGFPPGGNTNPG
jgi:hypothetical protein